MNGTGSVMNKEATPSSKGLRTLVWKLCVMKCCSWFVGLALVGKDIVFSFIMECSSLRDFGRLVIGLFLYEDF